MTGPDFIAYIADPKRTQKEAAQAYATLPPTSQWGDVNRAIEDRWSYAGLKRVKALAWKEAARD